MGQRNPNFGLWNSDDWSPSDASYGRLSKDIDSFLHIQASKKSKDTTANCTSERILHMFRLQEAEKLLVSVNQLYKLEMIRNKISSRKYWIIEEDEELLQYLVNMEIVIPMSKNDIIAFLLLKCYGIKKEEAD